MNNGDSPATACVVKASEQGKALGYSADTNYTGMTKREAFAMAAMQGLLANIEFPTCVNGVDVDEYELCANAAVKQADALLKELSK